MANYKSQYTGEQIDEAIGKVLNAPNIYNYDGTVIIEKAESVLGLRKFKDTIPYDVSSGESVYNSEYNAIFTLEITEGDTTITMNFDGILVQVSKGTGDWYVLVLYYYLVNATAGDQIATPEDMGMTNNKYPVGSCTLTINGEYDEGETLFSGEREKMFQTINVIECDDTAKAWLLANTEGVSV